MYCYDNVLRNGRVKEVLAVLVNMMTAKAYEYRKNHVTKCFEVISENRDNAHGKLLLK